MRRITQRATASADVADESDMGHRTEPGRVEFQVTWPWDESDAKSHGPEGPQIVVIVTTEEDVDLAEATLSLDGIDTLRAVLRDLDTDHRWAFVDDV